MDTEVDVLVDIDDIVANYKQHMSHKCSYAQHMLRECSFVIS